MAIEAKRGCGYRKVGGLYMVGGKLSAPCCKLPIIMSVCPTCGGGIKPARAWTWIDPRPWLQGPCSYMRQAGLVAMPCGASQADGSGMGDQAGLLWVGGSYYPTPEDFMREARALGVSRRIPALPKNFKLGAHWVLLAHRDGVRLADGAFAPAIFSMFKPTAVEKIVTQSQAADTEAMDALAKRGIIPVVVPDNDPDHQPTAADDAAELPLSAGAVPEGHAHA